MKIFISLLLIFNCSVSFAQKWDLFPMHQKSLYFSTKDSTVHGVVADSLRPDSNYDSVKFFNRKFFSCSNLEYDYHDPNGLPHYFIDSLSYKKDTIFFYHFTGSKPFYFIPTSNPGDSWIIKTESGTDKKISCTDKIQQTFFGLTDSVKIFSISPEGGNGDNPIYNLQIKLSKHYGLIEFVPFVFFINPDLEQAQAFTQTLIGFDHGDVQGYTMPDFSEYFNLETGDVLYWQHDEYNFFTTLGRTEYFRDSITKVTKAIDSVEYVYDRIVLKHNKIVQKYSALKEVYKREELGKYFESLPDWFFYHNDKQHLIHSKPVKLSIKEDKDTIVEVAYDFSHFAVWGCPGTFEYQESMIFNTALGLISNQYGHPEYMNDQFLIGYKISGVIHNLPDLPNGVIDKTIIQKVQVYPNPATEYVSIYANDETKFLTTKIYNVHGALVSDGSSTDGRIDISDLDDGLYYMIIEDDAKVLSTTFIKE